MAKQQTALNSAKGAADLDALLNAPKEEKESKPAKKAKIDFEALLAGLDLDISSTKKKKLLADLDTLLSGLEVEEKDEVLETLRLDLAPCAGMGLTHCGLTYMHGGVYTVPVETARDLLEMQRRGHSHEASITKQETKGRRRMNLDATTPISGAMAAKAAAYGF